MDIIPGNNARMSHDTKRIINRCLMTKIIERRYVTRKHEGQRKLRGGYKNGHTYQSYTSIACGVDVTA